MSNEIIVRSEKRLNDSVYVCTDCLTLLALRGEIKNCFVIKIDSDEPIYCDICGEEAKFFIAPFERGIWVCDDCLNEHGRKTIWADFKIVEENENMFCDLCRRRGAKHLVPIDTGV